MNQPGSREENFYSHLSELRLRLIYAVIFLLLGILAAVILAPQIIKLLFMPSLTVEAGIDFHTFSPPEIITFLLKITIWGGIILSAPFWLGQIILFVLPALQPGEKKVFWLATVFGVILFAGGVTFSHFIVLPLVMKFLVTFNRQWGIVPIWNIHEYIQFLYSIYLVFGLSFVLPEVVVILSYSGIIEPDSISRVRKYLIVILIIAAAVLTPPDVLTQLALAGPVWILFEISLLISRLLTTSKRDSTEKEKNNG